MYTRAFRIPLEKLSILSQRAEVISVGLGDVALVDGVRASLLTGSAPSTRTPAPSDLATWIKEAGSTSDIDLASVNGVKVLSRLQMFHVWRHFSHAQPSLDLSFVSIPHRHPPVASSSEQSATTQDDALNFSNALMCLFPGVSRDEHDRSLRVDLIVFAQMLTVRDVSTAHQQLEELLLKHSKPWYPAVDTTDEPPLPPNVVEIKSIVHYKQWLYLRNIARTVATREFAALKPESQVKKIRALQNHIPNEKVLSHVLRTGLDSIVQPERKPIPDPDMPSSSPAPSAAHESSSDARLPPKQPRSSAAAIFVNTVVRRRDGKTPWGMEIDKSGQILKIRPESPLRENRDILALELRMQKMKFPKIVEINSMKVGNIAHILTVLQNPNTLEVSLRMSVDMS